ncbi:MAG: P1 family peptidase [Spirochaetaceae bacterium]|nr:P1 family peptidase [Spirochaetaceae bacterium]
MSVGKRVGDVGIKVGELPSGPLGKIGDVPGVRVGHATIDEGNGRTGVTVLLPGGGDIFERKFEAASHVLNGFGKTAGLVQIDELGTLESPIAFTNTLNVGVVSDALVEYALDLDRLRGGRLTSVNPVVCECNDSYLNDIRSRFVRKEHVFEAIASASADFEEGGVGAGTGMSCHGLKGGIGSASRILGFDDGDYVLGMLVLSNHGLLRDLRVAGRRIGEELAGKMGAVNAVERGSCISVIATDLPLSSRQLGRLCRRVGVGLARLGSYLGHGSGEIAIAFSTANAAPNDSAADFRECRCLNEDRLDRVFRAVAECAEESVLNSMLAARRTVGFMGRSRESLADWYPGGAS